MHFVAGPWFTVHKSGDEWQTMDQIWISNGETDIKGRIEIRVELEQPGTYASNHTFGDTDFQLLQGESTNGGQ